MNSTYIISQIFAFSALVVSLLAFHRKKKEDLLKTSLVGNVLNIIHYLLLGAYNGCFTKVLAFLRNSFVIYKDKKKIKSKVYLIVFLVLYILVSVYTYKNIYSILPSISAIIYLIALWYGDELIIKRVGCFGYFLWLLYNIFVFSVVGIISNIVSIISTFIAAYNQELINKKTHNVKTIENDEKFLRKNSDDVSFEDTSYEDEIDVLKQFCMEKDSFAISAVQLGIPKRIVYLYKNEEKIIDKFLINPKIINEMGKTEYWEACTSVPNKIGLVERPYEVEVEYFDLNRNSVVESFTRLDATIIAHELDHLDGVLYIDKAKEVKDVTKDEKIKFRKDHPYRIISKK